MNRHTQDDDAALGQLFIEMELDSAIERLKRIGFIVVSCSKKHHLQRTIRDTIDDIFIELNERKQLIILFARDAMIPSNSKVITTWDEWACFVRLLILRPCLCRIKAIPEDQATPMPLLSILKLD